MARFIRFPWATTGDRSTVPFDTDPGGSVSYSQGFGPDYEIAPGDPGWKPVPRDGTNGFYYDLTDNIRQYQLNGAPDWHPAADNGGVAVSYPIDAIVRHVDTVWRSIAANNTAEPGTDATKWVADALFNLPLLEASTAEMTAASVGSRIVTPRRAGSAVQSGSYTYAAGGGTANAVTASLTPAPSSYITGMSVRVRMASTNTGAATLNLNGLGAVPIKTLSGADVIAGDLLAGAVMTFDYDGLSGTFIATNLSSGVGPYGLGAVRTFTSNGTWTRPAGCRAILVEVLGGGGAGGGASSPGAGFVRVGGGGGGGGYARKLVIGPPASQGVVVGAGGAGSNGSGTSGGTSSFGSIQATGGVGAPLQNPVNQPDASISTAGGVGSGGDINAAGMPGGRGVCLITNSWGGIGGSSVFGGGGFGSGTSGAAGGDGTGYGSGGGGAVVSNSTANAAGGNGASGVVIISEYF